MGYAIYAANRLKKKVAEEEVRGFKGSACKLKKDVTEEWIPE